MNRVELLKKVITETGYEPKAVKEVIDTYDCIILTELKAGEDVKTGMFTFVVKDTPQRQARNPKTGESVSVPAGKKVAIKLAKVLKDIFK